MSPLGVFERPPSLAVAVSGGPDSMALCLLTDAWARRRGGAVTALVVDHGLRPESGDEAHRVVSWLAARGIAGVLLTWSGPRPVAGIQAAARAARYRLMTDWCKSAGVLHLLLAHHRDDQAETVLLRLGRGSGMDGLAAMAAVVETAALRMLRPLLDTPKRRLLATLETHGQPWIEDPSNHDTGFARGRLRALFPSLAAEGVTAGRLTRVAAGLARARGTMEAAVAAHLAATVTVHPAGFCRLDPEAFRAAPEPLVRRALTRVLLCVGGGVYPPRGERLGRLYASVAEGSLGAGRTLAGCRLIPGHRGLLVCREASRAEAETMIEDGVPARWDGRFTVRATVRPKGRAKEHAKERARGGAGRMVVRRLGRAGWTAVAAACPALRDSPLPGAVRQGLPAFCDLDGVAAVPHLGFVRADIVGSGFVAAFRPPQVLAPPVFAFGGRRR